MQAVWWIHRPAVCCCTDKDQEFAGKMKTGATLDHSMPVATLSANGMPGCTAEPM